MVKKCESHKFSNLNLFQPDDRFPFIPQPFSDELLSSWIARLAIANYFNYKQFLIKLCYTDYDLFRKLIKIPSSFPDVDRNCLKDLINALSKKTGMSPEQLNLLTINKWENRVNPELFVCMKTNFFTFYIFFLILNLKYLW